MSRVELLTRFGTRLQSYIRPAHRASDEALALMDFRALRSADQSRGLSRPCVATEFGSAGPTGSPSASHKTPYATSARAVSVPPSVFGHTQFCAPRSLNRGWRAGAQNCAREYPARAVTITSAEQRPQYSRILVGHRDRGHIRSARGADSCHPAAARISFKLALSKCGARPVDQQRAQIAVTALGNPQEHGLAARGMLARHQPQIGTQLASILEPLRITHCGHQRRGGQRPHPGTSARRTQRSSCLNFRVIRASQLAMRCSRVRSH